MIRRLALLNVIYYGPRITPEQADLGVRALLPGGFLARTRATGGTGLGLAIVDALVTAQGGIASVDTGEGQGARFQIALRWLPRRWAASTRMTSPR